jgi:hypothetical protein
VTKLGLNCAAHQNLALSMVLDVSQALSALGTARVVAEHLASSRPWAPPPFLVDLLHRPMMWVMAFLLGQASQWVRKAAQKYQSWLIPVLQSVLCLAVLALARQSKEQALQFVHPRIPHLPQMSEKASLWAQACLWEKMADQRRSLRHAP